MRCNVENKIKFVRGLSNTIQAYQENIESVEYHVFQHTGHNWTQEYLVVNYVGGAKSYRNCNGNSFSAVFDELSKLLDSGYYVEERNYNDYVQDSNWKRIDLEIF